MVPILAAATALGALTAAMAVVGVIYSLVAGVLVGRYSAAPAIAPYPEPAPSVALLKPLHGAEPNLRANLETFLSQADAGGLRLGDLAEDG